MSPLAGEFFTSFTTWEACKNRVGYIKAMNSHGVLDGLLFFGVIDCHWGQIHTQACRNSFLDSVVLIFKRLIPYEICRYVFLKKKKMQSLTYSRDYAQSLYHFPSPSSWTKHSFIFINFLWFLQWWRKWSEERGAFPHSSFSLRGKYIQPQHMPKLLKHCVLSRSVMSDSLRPCGL